MRRSTCGFLCGMRSTSAQIDEAIAPLIHELWRLGFKTLACCQGDDPAVGELPISGSAQDDAGRWAADLLVGIDLAQNRAREIVKLVNDSPDALCGLVGTRVLDQVQHPLVLVGERQAAVRWF